MLKRVLLFSPLETLQFCASHTNPLGSLCLLNSASKKICSKILQQEGNNNQSSMLPYLACFRELFNTKLQENWLKHNLCQQLLWAL